MALFIFLPAFDNTAGWWPAWGRKGQRMLISGSKIIIGPMPFES
tara:strand:- start:52723 stop:52854 length:132 start_codon:yes stop_codon:yes gene_type:complete